MSEFSDASSITQLSVLDTNGQPTYKNFKFILLGCLSVALGNVFIGFNFVIYIGVSLHNLKKIYGITMDDTTLTGVIAGIYPLGGCIGSLITRLLLDRFTRRNLIRLICISAIFSTLLTLFPFFNTLIFGRFMCGVCAGVFTIVCPIYINELAPQDIRGKIGVLAQLGANVGRMTGLFINLFFIKQDPLSEPTIGYWIPPFFPVIFLTIQFVLLTYKFTIQTPKYYLIHRQQEQAFEVVKQIYKEKYMWDIFYRIFRDAESERKRRDKNQPTSYLAVLVAIVVALSVSPPRTIQSGGHKMLIVDFGVNKGNALYLLTCCASFFTAVFMWYVKNFGRRNVIIFGQLSTVMLFLLTGAASQSIFYHTGLRKILLIIDMVVFRLIWDLTLLTVSWVYIAETLQPKLIPWTGFFNWLSTASINYMFPIGITQLHMDWMYIIFGCWQLFLACFSYLYLVQSKGKTQIQIKQQYKALQNQICY